MPLNITDMMVMKILEVSIQFLMLRQQEEISFHVLKANFIHKNIWRCFFMLHYSVQRQGFFKDTRCVMRSASK